MERFARLVMHHRRIVSAVWFALFVGGMVSVSPLGDRWSLDFSLPGQPGDNAEQQLIDTYGVEHVRLLHRGRDRAEGGDRRGRTRMRWPVSSPPAVAAVPDVKLRVVDFASTGDPGFVTDDGRTTYALIQAPVPVTFGPYIETQLDPALARRREPQASRAG